MTAYFENFLQELWKDNNNMSSKQTDARGSLPRLSSHYALITTSNRSYNPRP